MANQMHTTNLDGSSIQNIKGSEFYLQYLQLKEDILELTQRMEIQRNFLKTENPDDVQQLHEAIRKMKEKIELLNLYGVSTEYLLFLSMNVDLARLNEKTIVGGNFE